MKTATKIGLFVLKTIGVILLLTVVFVGGFSYQDIRTGMRQPATLNTVLSLIPERLSLSLHSAAYGDTDMSSSPLLRQSRNDARSYL